MAPKRLFFSQEEEEDGSGSLVPKPKRSRPWNLCYNEVTSYRFIESFTVQLEPMLRAVVRDEVHKSLLNYVHPSPRSLISQIQESVRFQLYFQTGLPHTLFTGKGIKAEDKMPIRIAIKDSNNHVVTSGPISTLKIKIVVIDGDFNRDGKAMWSKEEFCRHIMRERCGKRPLLTGEFEVRMQGGVACIVDASFTDNSRCTRSGKFRLGAIVSDGRYAGERVQEAITEAFKVKDGRLESSQKDCPPSLDDEVCRLKKIQKDGAFHKKLTDNGIVTVQDFLRAHIMDPNKLRILLGKGMSNKWWKATLEHASQCVLGNKQYSFSVVGEGIDLVFNSIFELMGAKICGLYQPVDDLSPSLKGKLDHYKMLAYISPGNIFELHDSPLESLPRPLHATDVPSIPGSDLPNRHNSPCLATLQDVSSGQVEFQRQAYASCHELASEIPRPRFHPLHKPASLKKASSFRSSNSEHQHHFVSGPSTSLTPNFHATRRDEAAKESCRIVSNSQGFICVQRSSSFVTNKGSTNAVNEHNKGSLSHARTDSMEKWIAELLLSPAPLDQVGSMTGIFDRDTNSVFAPAPSSPRKWVQLSAAFKLVFIKQSAGRKARIAHPDHRAVASRA